jgi:hypothetical protein
MIRPSSTSQSALIPTGRASPWTLVSAWLGTAGDAQQRLPAGLPAADARDATP